VKKLYFLLPLLEDSKLLNEELGREIGERVEEGKDSLSTLIMH